jgi:prepilin peptidase CpaA
MAAEILALLVLPVLLALAAGWDLASFTIPNVLPLTMLAAFFLFALVAAMPGAVFGSHLAAGLIGLAAGFTLYAAGFVGGGDAKLFAVTALWFGFGDLLTYALVATLCGGALTFALLTLRYVPLPALLASRGWVVRLHEAKKVPYGVALAAGALALLPSAEIFRLAVSA